jgi:hypothetical protein
MWRVRVTIVAVETTTNSVCVVELRNVTYTKILSDAQRLYGKFMSPATIKHTQAFQVPEAALKQKSVRLLTAFDVQFG